MNSENVNVRQAGYEDRTLWDNYIAVHKEGLAYQLFAWRHAVEKSYGFDCPYFLAEQESRIVGILPTVHIHAPLRKGQLVSLPYCDAGGIIADSPAIAKSLLNYACQFALECKIPSIEIRYPSHQFNPDKSDNLKNNSNSSKHVNPGTSLSGKIRMLLELPESSETLLASFKSKLRSQIKKPGRDGLFLKIGGIELIEPFYAVFAENMRALGSPVHKKDWLNNILKYYGEKAKCGVVYMPDRTPAAAGIILCHDHIVSIPWASSLQCFNRFNPNMLLYWSFLKFATDNRYRFFDFGRSTPGEGTYNFKAQWGAKPQPLNWERWEIGKNKFHRVNMGGIQNSTGRSRVMAEKIIRNIPLPVASYIGSRLRKYISL